MKRESPDQKRSLPRFLCLFGWRPPSYRASRIFGLITAIGTNLGVLLVLWLAITDHPHRAVILLGGGVIVLGIFRGLWPGSPWFASRHRFLDTIAYIVLGVVIFWLSPWTATISPF